MASPSGPITTTLPAGSKAPAASSTCCTIGRPATAWSTLGRLERMRVPLPAARTTTTSAVLTGQTPSGRGETREIRQRPGTAGNAAQRLLQGEADRQQLRLLETPPHHLDAEGQSVLVGAAGQAEHGMAGQRQAVGDGHPVNIALQRLAIDLPGVPLILVERLNRGRRGNEHIHLVHHRQETAKDVAV